MQFQRILSYGILYTIAFVVFLIGYSNIVEQTNIVLHPALDMLSLTIGTIVALIVAVALNTTPSLSLGSTGIAYLIGLIITSIITTIIAGIIGLIIDAVILNAITQNTIVYGIYVLLIVIGNGLPFELLFKRE